MPNWSYNNLEITGDERQLKELKAKLLEGPKRIGEYHSIRKAYFGLYFGLIKPIESVNHNIEQLEITIDEIDGSHGAVKFLEYLSVNESTDLETCASAHWTCNEAEWPMWSDISDGKQAAIEDFLKQAAYDWLGVINGETHTGKELYEKLLINLPPDTWASQLQIHTDFEAFTPCDVLSVIVGFNNSVDVTLKEKPVESQYDNYIDKVGTKWPSTFIKVTSDYSTCLEFTFNTAWCPPEQAIMAMSEKWPDLKLELTTVCEGDTSCYLTVFEDGETNTHIDDLREWDSSEEQEELKELLKGTSMEKYIGSSVTLMVVPNFVRYSGLIQF